MSKTGHVTLAHDIMEKLYILNYEADFLSQVKLPPISHIFFTFPGDPKVVYPYFTKLCAWLLSKCQIDLFSMGMKPITHTITDQNTPRTIVTVCRNIGLSLDETILTPQNITSCDTLCLSHIVNFLTTIAVKKSGYTINQPDYSQISKIQTKKMESDKGTSLNERKNQIEKNPTEKDVNREQWLREYKSVEHRLDYTCPLIDSDFKNTMKTLTQLKTTLLPDIDKTMHLLNRTNLDFDQQLKTVRNREKYLDNVLDKRDPELADNLKFIKKEFSKLEKEESDLYSSIDSTTQNIQYEINRLADLKSKINAKNNEKTSGNPVFLLKQNIESMKNEVEQMEIRTKIVQQMLLHVSQRQSEKKRIQVMKDKRNITANHVHKVNYKDNITLNTSNRQKYQ